MSPNATQAKTLCGNGSAIIDIKFEIQILNIHFRVLFSLKIYLILKFSRPFSHVYVARKLTGRFHLMYNTILFVKKMTKN